MIINPHYPGVLYQKVYHFILKIGVRTSNGVSQSVTENIYHKLVVKSWFRGTFFLFQLWKERMLSQQDILNAKSTDRET